MSIYYDESRSAEFDSEDPNDGYSPEDPEDDAEDDWSPEQ